MVGRVSQPPVVPYTPILRRYHQVNALPEAKRYEQACQLAADPSPLAEDFRQSVKQLAAGYTHQGTFRPLPRVPERDGGLATEINNGNDLAVTLHHQQRLRVADHPELDVRWVDYELSILSTPGAAVFDVVKAGAAAGADPSRAGRAIRADLVMANAGDRTPVLGEVKIRRDKDPFAALIQLLGYIAHLSTPSQYKRFREQLPAGEFPDVAVPRFDGYLLLHQFDTTPNRWMKDLMAQTELLVAALLTRPEVSPHIRRLACLDVELDEHGAAVAAARWTTPS